MRRRLTTAVSSEPAQVKLLDTRRSEVVDIERPTPPFWGTQVLQALIFLWELFEYLDLQALIAVQHRKPKEQSKNMRRSWLRRCIQFWSSGKNSAAPGDLWLFLSG